MQHSGAQGAGVPEFLQFTSISVPPSALRNKDLQAA